MGMRTEEKELFGLKFLSSLRFDIRKISCQAQWIIGRIQEYDTLVSAMV